MRFVGQVSWQGNRGLYKRDQQHQNDRYGHDRNEFAHHSRDVKQGNKRDDRCRDAREDARQNFGSSVDSRLNIRFAHPSVCIDVFTDDNPVINNDSDGHEKGEHGQHVERLAECIQTDRSAENADGDPHGYPKR